MVATLLQSNTAASSVASPVSVTPTLGVASTKGNLLLLSVCVTGTTPSITTPAGWTLIQTNAPSGLVTSLFALSNNPGGITSVVVTVGGTGGGAVAAIFEFSGMGMVQSIEALTFTTGTSNTYTGVAAAQLPSFPNFLNELIFYTIGFAATSLTPANSGEWSAVVGGIASTNGVPNAQIASFWGIQGVESLPVIGGSLGASVILGIINTRFMSGNEGRVSFATNMGARGIYVGAFNQGMIGG